MPDETLYCVCRTSDIKRFMIMCDKCEDWFHGDCIDITQKAAKFIEKYFCRRCIEVDPSLQITYKPGKKPGEGLARKKKPAKKKRDTSLTPSFSSRGSSEGRRAGSSRDKGEPTSSDSESSGADEWNGQMDPRRSFPNDKDNHRRASSTSKKTSSGKAKDGSRPHKPSGSHPKARKDGTGEGDSFGSARPGEQRYDTSTLGAPSQPHPNASVHSGAPSSPTKSDSKKSPKAGRKYSSSHYLRRHSPRRSPSQDEEEEYPGFDWNALRQCYGPKCQYAAAPGSKYCSDECGRALARKRLLEIMPVRLEQMGDPNYAATQLNQKEMEEVRLKLAAGMKTLENLNSSKRELEETIIRGKQELPCSHEEEEHVGDEASSDNCDVHCVTCGLPQPLRTAVKHFEKCFNRHENQTSYGSLVPTPNSIFCDVQNPKTKTWCKRLKVLCPEHFRESAEDTAGVCGMPLTNEGFHTTGKFCRILKKNCSKHPSWERVKRAELDLEVLRAYMRMEELVEQEANLVRTIQSRGGIVQTLLNYTTIHKPEDLVAASLSSSVTVHPTV